MISKSTLLRLETQLDVVAMLLSGAEPQVITARPASGGWSVHENLAHLARHHAVFLQRIHRILTEESPILDRYRAEEDPDWPEWSRMSTQVVLDRLKDLRRELVQLIKGMSGVEASRVGIHPLFGEMSIGLWVKVMTRLGEEKRNPPRKQSPAVD